MDRWKARFIRAKDIYQKEGLTTLFKMTVAFLLSSLRFGYGFYYVTEHVLEKRNEPDFTPKIKDFTFKIVETTQQLDELARDGFDLSLLDITEARYRLEKGAIVILIFVERELALRHWSALTEEAKNTFNRYPYKVNFTDNEACLGGAWTNPKYRRQGLGMYSLFKLDEFLMSKGIKKKRGITLINNIAMLRVHEITDEKIGERRIYAKARYLRIGRLQFWKETPLESVKNNN